MWDEHSPNLSMPLLLPAQASKHVTHNEALLRLDALVHLAVLDRDTTQPPAAAEEGQRHIVPEGAVGAWAGQAGRVAVLASGGWDFLTPRPGWRVFVLAEGVELIWQDGAWQGGAARPLAAAMLGVNATADPVNRLAVSAEASLFSHAGSDHRLKLNKAGPAQTASLLYQSDWSGRAEAGLAGSDDFTLKVSADGSSWTEALRALAATGRLEAPQGLTVDGSLTGSAVTQSTTDTTPGRLVRTGDGGLLMPMDTNGPQMFDAHTAPSGFYRLSGNSTNVPFNTGTALVMHQQSGRSFALFFNNVTQAVIIRSRHNGVWDAERTLWHTGNILGTVSQSGGLPTGAIIQRGSNPNGEFMRFADGTGICTHALPGSSTDPVTWTFPAAFASATGLSAVVQANATGARFGTLDALNAFSMSFSVYNASGARTPQNARLLAIGRWF